MTRLGSSTPVEPTVPQADEAVMAREQAEALHVEILRLPAAFRLPVVLCDLEELSYEEIAATLNIKVGTVRSRIHRGRVLLREALAHRAPSSSSARDGVARPPKERADRAAPGASSLPLARRAGSSPPGGSPRLRGSSSRGGSVVPSPGIAVP